MRIKSLEIVGFKSFVDKVNLSFKPGITALIGPNGCGKSNLVDAVRWIMGEQNVRSLRGKTMEDLIFNGSQNRKPLGMAEVSLILTNDNGNGNGNGGSGLPSEIMITRRLFRSGESEYFINKTPCRLRDIVELFLDAGFGTKSYSIIEQGKVDYILALKPQEKRTLIEEAAGIAKYRIRKKEAVSKMESTKQNLLRIQDVLHEMQNQMKMLSLQVKRLNRYKKLKDEIKTLDMLIASHKLRQFINSQTTLQETQQKLQDEEISIATQKKSAEALLEKDRLLLVEANKNVAALQQMLYQTKNKIKEEESSLEYNKKEVQNLSNLEKKYSDSLAELEKELQNLDSEIDLRQNEVHTILNDINSLQKSLSSNTELLYGKRNLLAEINQEIEKEKGELIEIVSARAEQKNAILLNLNMQREINMRLKRLKEEKNTCGKKVLELEAQISQFEKSLQNILSLIQGKEVSIDKQKKDIDSLVHILHSKDTAMNEMKENIAIIRSNVISLQNLQKNFEGFDDGVRSLMKEAEHSLKATIVALFADIIETPPEYEFAVESVLNKKIQSVIMNNQEDCLHAIEHLKCCNGGRASFIPVTSAAKDAPVQTYSDVSDTVVPLTRLIQTDPCYRYLVENLLGNVLVAENITQAVNLWHNKYRDYTIVTVEGEIIEPPGIITGGSRTPAENGLLQRKRKIRELSDQLSALETQLQNLSSDREKISQNINSMKNVLENLSTEKHNLDLQLMQQQTHKKQLIEELKEQKDKYEILNAESDENTASLSSYQKELKNHIFKEAFYKWAEDKKRKNLQGLQHNESLLKEELASLESVNTDLKVKLAAIHEKRESAVSNLNRLGDARKSGALKKRAILEEKDKLKSNLVSLSQQIEESDKNAYALMKTSAEIERKINTEQENVKTLEENITTGEDTLKTFNRRYNEIEPKIHQTNLALSETSLRIEHLKEEIAEKYSANLDDLPPSPSDEDFNREEAQERIVQLKKRLENIGEVNLSASKQYDEIQSRYDFLHTQQEDLYQSIESLKNIIAKINRTTKQKFSETFNEINKHFKEIFPILFNGGKAYMLLTDESDLLETGIEIFAQPPGKKLQNLELLSGGERALTVVALLFAIFLTKPSPFCLLDEIDAPLDEANIERFTQHLQKLTNRSQFIIVTHNKQSMLAADVLYGVTMQESGVSKVVSVNLH